MNGEHRRSLGRTLGWTALLLLIAGAVLLAYLIGQNGSNPAAAGPSASSGSTSGSGTSAVPNAQAIDIVAAHDFDPSPGSDGVENPKEVPNAYDGDPSTAWTTLTYTTNSHLGNLKPGVGLILDLGDVHTVTDVAVSLEGSPTDLELRAAPEGDSDYPTASADDYSVVKTLKGAGSDADFDLSDSPVETRYLLVWITNLPPIDATHWRAGISEITVSGD